MLARRGVTLDLDHVVPQCPMLAPLSRTTGVRGAAAEEAFARGLGVVEGLGLPFQRGLLELAYGQVLRRRGQRRGSGGGGAGAVGGVGGAAVCAAV